MASKKTSESDDRFLRVQKDPRFWEMPERQHKIKIDKRFQSMFHDKRFKLKSTVDKRGRPITHSFAEDLKRFYDLSDSEISEPEEEEDGKAKKKTIKKKQKPKLAEETVKGREKQEGKQLQEKTELKKSKKQTVGKKPQKSKGVIVCEENEDDDDEEEESCTDDEEEGSDSGAEFGEGRDDEGKEGSVGDESEEEEEGSEEDSDSGPDLARGKGNVETSSDEDDEDDVEDLLRHEEEEIEHDWGELWKDAPREENVTGRLAVCNMDWDRIKAKDLLALLSSFKPKGGVVLSVKIYPSEFGKERIRVEQSQGPLELMDLPEDPEKDTEEERIYREKMRDYQFKRMRYYYAVVECDSPQTASKIYEQCDGYEYETSCSNLDLRFIPDDFTFDDEPKDIATDVDLAAYTPKYFTSTAMATSKVVLTWDETDHERITTLNRTFKKDEILDMDFKAYLASSSEEEETEEEEEEELEVEPPEGDASAETQETNKKSHKNNSEQIAKYRELIQSIKDKERKQEDKDMEMEITWVPGLKATAEQLVKKKLEGTTKLTPWEEYLHNKKEKKKQKKLKAKQAGAQEEADLSDDELPPDVDLNDPYFAEELETGSAKKAKSKSKKKGKKEEPTAEEEAELEKQRAEMALLMDDGEDDKRRHFNYDQIVEQQNLSKRKKKQMLKRKELPEKDDFQVDVKDPRFQALFTSHLYNLDPSDPGFKKTKATETIVEEKRRRLDQEQRSREEDIRKKERQEEEENKVAAKRGSPAGEGKKEMDPSLSVLIKSIKNKTEQFQARKNQKTK